MEKLLSIVLLVMAMYMAVRGAIEDRRGNDAKSAKYWSIACALLIGLEALGGLG